MTHHQINIADRAEIKDQAGIATASKVEAIICRVLKPLFKRQQLWCEGDLITLDPKTAERAKQAGDVE